jgi:voltage-gated potassium channel Kch
MIGACIGVLGLALLFVVLWDAFETIVLPRRVQRRVRLARLFYGVTWRLWAAIGRRMRPSPGRDAFLSYYGPLSLLLLLVVWALILILSFTLLHWGFATALVGPEGTVNFGGALYMSGSTLFTLGIGDITPRSPLGRLFTVAEAGTGIAFLALVIGYLPVIYQAFSRREASISLLDARAGSPPSAAELLIRQAEDERADDLAQFLHDWERWAAELLESHLSYPVLAYYRSQHDRESWLAALTMVLDVCALILAGIDGAPTRAARLTFAMARHAAVDLSQIFGTPPQRSHVDRLPPSDLVELRAILAAAGMPLRAGPEADQQLAAIRAKYEPYVDALAEYLLVGLPPWMAPPNSADDWQTSIWEHAATGGGG